MFDNVFHCCVQKTGSQWIKAILNDEAIQEALKVKLYTYQAHMPGGFDPRILTERSFDKPFPVETLVSPLYIDFLNFKRIPKPDNFRAFFVMRDPRDIVVSWYYSVRYSHALMGGIADCRKQLETLNLPDGMKFSIDYLDAFKLFEALRSWKTVETGEDIIILRYEDLVGTGQHLVFDKLFRHLGLSFSVKKREGIVEKYSFKSMSKRDPGQEDKSSHLRKGIVGDWQNNFSDDVKDYFNDKTRDLLVVLGYENSLSW